MSYYDKIRIPGLPGNSPPLEVFQGIGAQPICDNSSIFEAFDLWRNDWKTWLSGILLQVEEAEAAYLAGEMVAEFDPGTPPVITLPPPVEADSPPLFWVILKIINFFIGIFASPLVSFIIGEIIRSIRAGGDTKPLIKLLKKALLVKEGDIAQGMEDYTALLLLNMEKPIEIYDACGVKDVFLDTRVVDEDELP